MGGIAGGIGIKVGNMVPACCECNPGGSIADLSFPEAPVFYKRMRTTYAEEGCGRGMAERSGLQPSPAAGGE